jgi:hypothetical protein
VWGGWGRLRNRGPAETMRSSVNGCVGGLQGGKEGFGDVAVNAMVEVAD